MSRLEEKEEEKTVTDSYGTYAPVYPLDNEKNLKMDYSCENALKADLEEMDFDAPEATNAPWWVPKFNYGKVVKVHDGDTFHIISSPVNSDGQLYKFSCRLRDIDTPEIKDVRYATPESLQWALKAKKCLSDLILGKVVRISDIGKDKYGRLLCHAYINNVDVTSVLLKQGLGYVYHGGKKQTLKPPGPDLQ